MTEAVEQVEKLLYLEALARRGDAEQDIEELRRLGTEGQGRSRGWRFDRDEIHARP